MRKRKVTPEDFSQTQKTIRVVMGPQDDCFTEKGVETFLSSTYAFTNESDRMGCRLEGEVIEHKNGGDIITDGIAFGAIQVPSHGQPIIMMADHQTTGGELDAVIQVAVGCESKKYWNPIGTYRVVIDGTEYMVELEEETERFR